MKFRIVWHISKDKLIDILPSAYRGLASMDRSEDVPYTAIIFHQLRNGVVPSSVVHKAISQLGEVEGQVIALGGNFTLEAQVLLRGRGIEILSLRNFPWTDESCENIKVSSGSRMKRPSK